MNVKVRVWHITNLRMDAPVTFGTKGAFAAVADIVTEAPMVPAEAPRVLDEAYGRSQHLYEKGWFDHDGIMKLVDHNRVRSTSVGDVLEVLIGDNATAGAIYLVKGIGFERIDPLTTIDWSVAHGC